MKFLFLITAPLFSLLLFVNIVDATTIVAGKVYCRIGALNCDDGGTGPTAYYSLTFPAPVAPGAQVSLYGQVWFENRVLGSQISIVGQFGCQQGGGGCQHSLFNFNPSQVVAPATLSGLQGTSVVLSGVAPSTPGDYVIGFNSDFQPAPAGYIAPYFSYASGVITVSQPASITLRAQARQTQSQ